MKSENIIFSDHPEVKNRMSMSDISMGFQASVVDLEILPQEKSQEIIKAKETEKRIETIADSAGAKKIDVSNISQYAEFNKGDDIPESEPEDTDR